MLDKSPRLPGEARLKYLDATFKITSPGEFVVCAVTGKQIPLSELRYWSVDEQAPYADAAAANQAMVPRGESSSS
tara:strand:+ start:862 stop:1086 length:225 start_codon:yes stop_codon:yes gene_type:complete